MSLEDFLTNKYFTLAILVILAAVLIAFYFKGDTCSVKELMSVDEEIKKIDPPYLENNQGEDVGNKLYKKMNEGSKSTYDRYMDYMSKSSKEESDYLLDSDSEPDASFPKPMDARPDLSQCQPCAPCPPCDRKEKPQRYQKNVDN